MKKIYLILSLFILAGTSFAGNKTVHKKDSSNAAFLYNPFADFMAFTSPYLVYGTASNIMASATGFGYVSPNLKLSNGYFITGAGGSLSQIDMNFTGTDGVIAMSTDAGAFNTPFVALENTFGLKVAEILTATGGNEYLGGGSHLFLFNNGKTEDANLQMNLLSTTRTFTFPDKSGTFAMTSDINTYSAGTGLSLSGTVFSLQVPVILANGGTNRTSAVSQGIVFDSSTSLTTSNKIEWDYQRNTLLLGNPTVEEALSTLIQQGNANNYIQDIIRNSNSGSNASVDRIWENNLDSTNYGDIGMNSSTYTNSTYNSQSADDFYLYSNKASVAIGTASAGDSVKITAGGLTKANEMELITPAKVRTLIDFEPDTFKLPIYTTAITPKHPGQEWIYENAGGDTVLCRYNGKRVDSTNYNSVAYTPSLTGFSSTTTNTGYYIRCGKNVTVFITISGTSNATGFTATLPSKAAVSLGISNTPGFGTYYTTALNAGSVQGCVPSILAGSNVVTLGSTQSNTAAGWTSSGTKGGSFMFQYIEQ